MTGKRCMRHTHCLTRRRSSGGFVIGADIRGRGEMIDFAKLREPFPASDVEWRLQECGKTKDGKIWAMCLAYITNRAIMQRLDDVCSPENWKNEYHAGPQGGVICGLSIRCGDEWVTKWDGADNTQVEATKGGLSDAMKRAGVQWGIGRYLYNLEAGFATIADNGEYRGKTKDNTYFKWNPPKLPAWALPQPASNTQHQQPEQPRPQAAKSGAQGAKGGEGSHTPALSEDQAKYFPRVKAALDTLFGSDVAAKKQEIAALTTFKGRDGNMVEGKEDYRKMDGKQLQVLCHKLESAVKQAEKNTEMCSECRETGGNHAPSCPLAAPPY